METIHGASATSVKQLCSDSSLSFFLCTCKLTPSSSEPPSTEVDADSQSFPGCGTGSVKVAVAHEYRCELRHHEHLPSKCKPKICIWGKILYEIWNNKDKNLLPLLLLPVSKKSG